MRNLLLASAVIVLAAASAPGLFMRYLERSGQADAPLQAREVGSTGGAAEPAGASGLRVHEVEIARDGHFYVDADINFRPVHLVVDTGATVVALRESDAVSAGIRMRPTDFRHPVQTANGTTNAAQAMLDSVDVAGIEVRNVRALVLPDDQLSISLLGGSFLNGLERFEVRDGTLTFEN